MSYDLQFGVETVHENNDGEKFVWIAEPEYCNPTYNLRDIFVHSMDWDYKQGEWYRLEEVLPKIERGIDELTNNPAAYEKYLPSNGWGTIESAIKTLRSILYWVAQNNENPCRAWDTDALWFRW